MLYFNEKEVKILFWGALIAKQKLVCVYFGFFGVCLGYDNNKFVYFDEKRNWRDGWRCEVFGWRRRRRRRRRNWQL